MHIAPTYGEDYLAAELDRLNGLLLQEEQAPITVVEEYLARSLETARRQGARLLELRTATTFARVLAENNQRRRAVDLLAPVHGGSLRGSIRRICWRRRRCWMSLASSLASGPRPASPCCARAGPPARTMEREIRGGDVPREGVQRDLLPELQERLPIRVELASLSRADLRRILTEPKLSLVKR